jgi:hypothetical protein
MSGQGGTRRVRVIDINFTEKPRLSKGSVYTRALV